MNYYPKPGDYITLETGDATILETRDYFGFVKVLASRNHPVHPFAIWNWDAGALFSGQYFRTLKEAETVWEGL